MGLPAHDDEEEQDDETTGLDVELDTFEHPERDLEDGEVIDLGTPDELDDDPSGDDSDEAGLDLPEEPSDLLELPADGDDAPSNLADDDSDLLGDERSTDDGGEEGFDDEEDALDEPVAAEGSEADQDGIDVMSDEALPPWAEGPATRIDHAEALRFDPAPPLGPRELAVGHDASGARLVVLDDEDGAIFYRGDAVVSSVVPELPLAGVALLGDRPIYWVEGDGLYDTHVYVAGTQGLAAMAAAEDGLVLAISARGEHALALWRAGGVPERIATLASAPQELRVSGRVVAVLCAAGLETFSL